MKKVWIVKQIFAQLEGDATELSVCDTNVTAQALVRKIILEDLDGDDPDESGETANAVEAAQDIATAIELWEKYRNGQSYIDIVELGVITKV